MVVCRYFLRGTCRFGNNCRFEHNAPNYNSNINLAQQQQPYQQHQQQQAQPSSNDFNEMVQRDLEWAERSGQWILSCYCPYPMKSAALPGLYDYSPEEVRCLLYEGKSNGKVDSYTLHLQKVYQEAKVKRNIFKTQQSQECKAILERVRSGPASPSSNRFQNSASGPSIFGGSSVEASSVQPSPSIFGGSPATQASVFGGGSVSHVQGNPFGAATAAQPSIFGGGSAATTANPFVGQTSIFSGAAAPAPQPAPTSSMFGGSFSGQPNVFGGQPSASGVGSPSVFGGGSSAMNSFSFAAVAQNQGFIPASPATPPLMGQGQTVGSIFGGSGQPSNQAVAVTSVAPAVAPTGTPVTNPFGAQTQPLNTVAPPPDMGTHTSFNDLSEAEKAEFMAPTFSKGRIPLRPPPIQLCS